MRAAAPVCITSRPIRPRGSAGARPRARGAMSSPVPRSSNSMASRLGEDRREGVLASNSRRRRDRPGSDAGRAAPGSSRDATSRRSESRHCRRRRSGGGRERSPRRSGRPGGTPPSGLLRGLRLPRTCSAGSRSARAHAEIDQHRRRDEDRRIGADHDAEEHDLREALDRPSAEEHQREQRQERRSSRS